MFNGWTNYQTWRFVVELDNNEFLYQLWRNEIKNIYRKHECHIKRVMAFTDFLCETIELFRPETGVYYGHYSDILDNALETIDYREIAESFVADYEVEVS